MMTLPAPVVGEGVGEVAGRAVAEHRVLQDADAEHGQEHHEVGRAELAERAPARAPMQA
jgi:hypothetical protein